jgi:quercetin dioxygenase-like cupin family protein
MQIIRSSVDTQKGAADWFTGDVYIDAVAAPAGTSTFAAALVHFTPGARTAWHTHPHGQTIFVTEGVGLCQREGGPVEMLRPGDRVFFEPGENHWHGSAPSRFMVHIAMQQNDESGSPVAWGRHVTGEEYTASPTSADWRAPPSLPCEAASPLEWCFARIAIAGCLQLEQRRSWRRSKGSRPQ